MSTTVRSLADVKGHLSEIVCSAESTHERTTITKNGRPAAVLMSVEDLESLEETLEVMRDPDALADLRESEINRRHGFHYTENEVWDGERQRSTEESENMVVARMGREAYDAARAAIGVELLAVPGEDIVARELRRRAQDYM